MMIGTLIVIRNRHPIVVHFDLNLMANDSLVWNHGKANRRILKDGFASLILIYKIEKYIPSAFM